MKVWILQTGEPIPGDAGHPRPMRAMNLSKALSAAGHQVVLWSSAFNHQEKRHRLPGSTHEDEDPGIVVRLIDSPGYQRNIGPGRLWDHLVLARNLANELDLESTVPDVAFVGYPPIETAAVMTRWLAQRGVPSMLDVKDQWPTIFTDPLPALLRPLGRLALAPYFHYARRAMRDASALSAMAGDFLAWAAVFAGRPVGPMDRIVPLTTPTDPVAPAQLADAEQWWDQQGVVADGRMRVCFVGSHTGAFDMGPVAEAARTLAGSEHTVEFVICGDGASTPAWKTMMRDLPHVRFPGWIDRAKYEALARRCHAALAPYRSSPDFMLSLPNKVIDALALGLPVLSPLQGEVARLIQRRSVGLMYGPQAGRTLQQCLKVLKTDPEKQKQIAANARTLHQEQFSFERVYGGLVSHLEQMARQRKPS